MNFSIRQLGFKRHENDNYTLANAFKKLYPTFKLDGRKAEVDLDRKIQEKMDDRSLTQIQRNIPPKRRDQVESVRGRRHNV